MRRTAVKGGILSRALNIADLRQANFLRSEYHFEFLYQTLSGIFYLWRIFLAAILLSVRRVKLWSAMFLPNVAYPMTTAQRVEITAMHIAYAATASIGIAGNVDDLFTITSFITMAVAMLILLLIKKLFFRGINNYSKDELPDLSRRVADMRHQQPLASLWHRAMAGMRLAALFVGVFIVLACLTSAQDLAMGPVFSVLRLAAWVGFTIAFEKAWRSYADYARTERRLLAATA